MRYRVAFFLFLTAACLVAQLPVSSPYIEQVVNAASYRTDVAQGSMFIIQGLLLGPSPLVQVSGFPLPTALGGTSISITADGQTIRPWLIYASFGQVAAVLPSATPTGAGRLTLTFNGKTSNSVNIRVVKSSFGIFTRNEAGSGPGIVQNVESTTIQPVNALHLSARPGQVMVLWGTGMGPVSADEQSRVVPGDLPVATDVFVGGKPAKVLYRGRSGCCAGIDQIVFEVPTDLEGCRIPVAVRIEGTFSNFVTISVALTGRACPDPPLVSTEQLAKTARGETTSVARIELLRFDLATPVAEVPKITFEYAVAAFLRYKDYELLRATDTSSFWRAGAPSPGQCAIVQVNSSSDSMLPIFEDPLRATRLDAGAALHLSGNSGVMEMGLVNNQYFEFLGGFDGEDTHPLFLEPGTYTLDNGNGGKDVPAFKATLAAPKPLEWSNDESVSHVSKAEDLTLVWRSSDAERELVTVIAASWSGPETASGLLCTQYARAGQITIPSWLLSEMVTTYVEEGVPFGFIALANSPLDSESRIQIPGIDAAVLQYVQATGKLVEFR